MEPEKELHVLVDFENVHPAFDQLAAFAPDFTKVWLFHGPNQMRMLEKLMPPHELVVRVPLSKTGPNALDFHLTFYLGYVAAKHPSADLVVISNDTGYDPMIMHAESLGFTVHRIGFETKKVLVAKDSVAPVPVSEPAPAAQPVAPKKTASAKQPAAAKKAAPVAKQVPAKKAVAAKAPAPAKKAVAKKVAAKKATAKKVAAKKSPPAKKAVAKAPVPAKNAAAPGKRPAPEAKQLARVKTALAKVGKERPTKLPSFLRHMRSVMGKGSTPEAADALVLELQRQKVIRIADQVVHYVTTG